MKRRWRDGPTWKWLCSILGHQKNWWHWYVGAGDCLGSAICGALGFGDGLPKPSWHYHGTGSAKGMLCGRCFQPVRATSTPVAAEGATQPEVKKEEA